MVSYNEVDGQPNAQSKYLLTDLPRNQLDGNGPSKPCKFIAEKTAVMNHFYLVFAPLKGPY